jgi:hypothetical protein
MAIAKPHAKPIVTGYGGKSTVKIVFTQKQGSSNRTPQGLKLGPLGRRPRFVPGSLPIGELLNSLMRIQTGIGIEKTHKV